MHIPRLDLRLSPPAVFRIRFVFYNFYIISHCFRFVKYYFKKYLLFLHETKLLFCEKNECFVLKETNKDLSKTYEYLQSLGVSNIIYPKIDCIREGLIELMVNDEQFIESIEMSTSSQAAVITRFDKFRQMVQDIVGINSHEPRILSYSIKKSLFEANPTCAICNQQILSIDDSAVDHIEQYWKGGKTISENARLTHRFCNWARSRKD